MGILKMWIGTLLLAINVVYLLMYVMHHAMFHETPTIVIPWIFTNPWYIFCVIIISGFIIFRFGRFTVKDEIRIAHQQLERDIDSKYNRLADYIEFAQTLLNDDAKTIIENFKEKQREKFKKMKEEVNSIPS